MRIDCSGIAAGREDEENSGVLGYSVEEASHGFLDWGGVEEPESVGGSLLLAV